MFAPDIWGGYLLVEWPQVRVFVDSRWDMYGDAFFERYAPFQGLAGTYLLMGRFRPAFNP